MDDNNNKKHAEDIHVEKRDITRKENPSLVGATLIKYVAYIAIVLIVLYFIVNYILPRF